MSGNSSNNDSATSDDSSAGDVQHSKPQKYFEGEKVLVYDIKGFYEAKVLEAEPRENKWKYLVHYPGWNKNWDEWADEFRLMKYTEENVMKSQALGKKARARKKAKPGCSRKGKAKNSMDAKVDKEDIKSNVSEGKKRKNDSGAEVSVTIEKLVKIQIPATLNKQLVDDWDFVTQQDKGS